MRRSQRDIQPRARALEAVVATEPIEPAEPAEPGDDQIDTLGGRIAFTLAGRGEPVLLIHGLGGTRRTWRHVIPQLSQGFTVIAPDLPGHGGSATPAGDYSLGAHASAIRDLLVALGHRRATIIGHSLGGGVALQFAYQFPERTDRLVLISSGGLGTALTPLLRAATLPGAEAVVGRLGRLPERLTRAVLTLPGITAREDVRPLAEGLRGLAGADHRHAFVQTARGVIDWRGQSVSALRQLSLLADLPVLVAWGANDRTIPPEHHHALAEQVPHAQLLEIAGAGHYPHETATSRLMPPILQFLLATRPHHYTESRWRDLLLRRPPGGPGARVGNEPIAHH